MINVLIVDDSAIVCAMLRQVLEDDSRFCVKDVAVNGEQAILKNTELSPDLIIMDINMPIKDGITATREILQTSNPAIVVYTTEDYANVGFKSIEAGALEVIKKPDFVTMTAKNLQDFTDRLVDITEQHLKNPDKTKASRVIISGKTDIINSSPKEKKEKKLLYDIMLIGASTGGPAAIQNLLAGLGKDFPLPILITQHIDVMFDLHFAQWLTESTQISTTLAYDGIIPQKGHAYLAPANKHLSIVKSPAKNDYVILLNDDPPLHFLKPSVDKMFTSAVSVYHNRILAVLLTGMGADGSEGMVEITKAGGYTIAESEESCIVFGMPKAAIDKGGAKAVIALNKMPDFIKSLL